MNQGLDLSKLADYLADHRSGLFRGPLSAELLAGGRSNLTYAVTDGTTRLVLRRPPLAHVQATAHDMGREYRVISALGRSSVPVPATVLCCADDEVVGAPFYLMEFSPGTAHRHRSSVAALGPEALRTLAFDLVDTLVALHAVDPAAVGLADLGRPTGFNTRQVRTWTRQLQSLRSRALPGVDELAELLAADIPETGSGGLVHGDYRLDNVLVQDDGVDSGTGGRSRPRITAVLDWEMSTLGDPLSDLALLLLYAEQPMLAGDSADQPSVAICSIPGYPSAPEIIGRYAQMSGRDVSALRWYRAFAAFKLAVVLEGVHFRHANGATLGSGFDGIADMVRPLIEQGLTIVRER